MQLIFWPSITAWMVRYHSKVFVAAVGPNSVFLEITVSTIDKCCADVEVA